MSKRVLHNLMSLENLDTETGDTEVEQTEVEVIAADEPIPEDTSVGELEEMHSDILGEIEEHSDAVTDLVSAHEVLTELGDAATDESVSDEVHETAEKLASLECRVLGIPFTPATEGYKDTLKAIPKAVANAWSAVIAKIQKLIDSIIAWFGRKSVAELAKLSKEDLDKVEIKDFAMPASAKLLAASGVSQNVNHPPAGAISHFIGKFDALLGGANGIGDAHKLFAEYAKFEPKPYTLKGSDARDFIAHFQAKEVPALNALKAKIAQVSKGAGGNEGAASAVVAALNHERIHVATQFAGIASAITLEVARLEKRLRTEAGKVKPAKKDDDKKD